MSLVSALFSGSSGLRANQKWSETTARNIEAHDQLDVDKEDRDEDGASVASTESARDRASRSEPEKKRARDQEAGGSLPVRLAPTQPCC